jgi:hypothetical protein
VMCLSREYMSEVTKSMRIMRECVLFVLFCVGKIFVVMDFFKFKKIFNKKKTHDHKISHLYCTFA